MKPHRVRMTHNLLLHYGLYKEMEVRTPTSLLPPLYSINPRPSSQLRPRVSFVDEGFVRRGVSHLLAPGIALGLKG